MGDFFYNGDKKRTNGNGSHAEPTPETVDPFDNKIALHTFLARVREARRMQDETVPEDVTAERAVFDAPVGELSETDREWLSVLRSLSAEDLRWIKAQAQVNQRSAETQAMSDFEGMVFKAVWKTEDQHKGRAMRLNHIRRTFEADNNYRLPDTSFSEAFRRLQDKGLIWRPRGGRSQLWNIDPLVKEMFFEGVPPD